MFGCVDYYEPENRSEAQKRVRRGQFWWSCHPYIPTTRRISRFVPGSPIHTLDIGSFDPRKEDPDGRAKTQPGEFLAITKFKKRPVVVVSTGGDYYRDRAWKGGDCFLVAPVRSLRDPVTGEYKTGPNFVWSVITYKFSCLFYLPPSDKFDMHESVVHLDRMTAVHRSWLLEPRKAHLTSDATICLDEWLRNYICGKVRRRFNEDLQDYHAMVGDDPKIRAGVFR